MPITLPLEETAAWIRLSLEPGLGPVQARSLLAAIGLPQEIYAQPAAALAKVVPQGLARQLRRPADAETESLIARSLQWLEQPRHHMLTLAEPAYPPALLDIHDPPLLLYVNGDPGLLSRPIVSIVGARNATAGGMDNARAFARHLAGQGWCVASGLAHGVDAAAHQGALQAGPQGAGTVAVMGTGIDIIYPSANLELARQIAREGALVSELALGTPSLPHQFPRRNRIVAGLARGVLVVEAARQSGSLITARLASEAGREVFAIPGSIHSPLSRGCHALIRQGAKLVESGQDIHEELGAPGGGPPSLGGQGPDASPRAPAAARRRAAAGPAQAPPQPHMPPNPDAATVLAALGHDPVDIDTLHTRTGLGIAQLNGALLALEMADAVSRQDDGRYQRRNR